MFLRFIVFFILSLLIFPGMIFSSGKKDKYLINPVIQNFDSFPDFPNKVRLYVGSFQSRSPVADSGIIGYTRTGIKKTAPIICTQPLAASVRNSFIGLLRSKKAESKDISTASFIVNISIIEFSLDEKSSFLTQTMNSRIKLSVQLTDPLDSKRVRQFVVESENFQTALDTSKYSEIIVRSVLEIALREVWKTINK